jgi:Leucine-rich repeat (LRR) protein
MLTLQSSGGSSGGKREDENGENSSPQTLSKLEFFHQNLDLGTLHQYENLKSLAIVAQNTSSIHGLETLKHLTHLWICETDIKHIQGLSNCISLTHLYLQVY